MTLVIRMIMGLRQMRTVLAKAAGVGRRPLHSGCQDDLEAGAFTLIQPASAKPSISPRIPASVKTTSLAVSASSTRFASSALPGSTTIDDTLYDAFGQRQIAQYFAQLASYHVIMEILPTSRPVSKATPGLPGLALDGAAADPGGHGGGLPGAGRALRELDSSHHDPVDAALGRHRRTTRFGRPSSCALPADHDDHLRGTSGGVPLMLGAGTGSEVRQPLATRWSAA